MAIVANGEIERLNSATSSSKHLGDGRFSILNSIYKFKKDVNNKFSSEEECSRRRASEPANMTNRVASPDSQSSQNSTTPTSSSSSVKDANQSASNNQSIESASKTMTSSKVKSTKELISKSNSSAGCTLTTKTPSPSNVQAENSDNSTGQSPNHNKQQQQNSSHQPNSIPATLNDLTTSPPLSTANKFSIANILNEDCEALDNYGKRNPQRLPVSSLLTPNMMLNQNDLAALSSLNLIAWQASYAAQHAQAGKFVLSNCSLSPN